MPLPQPRNPGHGTRGSAGTFLRPLPGTSPLPRAGCRVPCAACRVPWATCHVPCAVCHVSSAVPCAVGCVPCTVCHAPYVARHALCRVPRAVCHASGTACRLLHGTRSVLHHVPPPVPRRLGSAPRAVRCVPRATRVAACRVPRAACRVPCCATRRLPQHGRHAALLPRAAHQVLSTIRCAESRGCSLCAACRVPYTLCHALGDTVPCAVCPSPCATRSVSPSRCRQMLLGRCCPPGWGCDPRPPRGPKLGPGAAVTVRSHPRACCMGAAEPDSVAGDAAVALGASPGVPA